MLDVRYLIYVILALAVVVGTQAALQHFSSFHSYRRKVNSRLKIVDQSYNSSDSLIELRRRRSLSAEGTYVLPIIWLNRLVMQSGVRVNARTFLVFMCGAAVIICAAIYFFSREALLACAIGVLLGFGLPLQALRFARTWRIRRFEAQLPDGVDVMVRSLRAGHPVPVALSMVAGEMPDPIGSEFGMAFDEVSYGLDIETAMANMRARVGQAELALLVVSVSIQSKTGGNLAEILGGLSKVLRDRFRMQRKVRALSAEGRFSAIGLTVLPLFVTAGIFASAPRFYTDVWDDPIFYPVIIFAALLMLLGDYIMYRLVSFKF
jgi:tight adherence protein B